jgi:uncharacterized protein (TIGR03437 family)
MRSDYVLLGMFLAAAACAQQPSNTTAFVVNERDLTLVQVTGGVAAPFGTPPACTGCFNYDIARDAARGNFVVAAGAQLTIYPATGGAATATITVKQLVQLNSSLFADTPDLVSIAVDAGGNYIVADNANNQIFKITLNAANGPAAVVQIASFNSFVFNPYAGDAFVRLDSSGNYILAFDNSNSYLVGSARPGHSRTRLHPDDSDGDGPTLTVLRIPAGTTSAYCEASLGPTTCESISVAPNNDFVPSTVGGLTLDAGGNYVITDWYDEYIFTISPTGGGSTGILDGLQIFNDPLGIYYDSHSGYFFLVDDVNETLYSLGPSGCQTSCLKTILTGGALTAPGSLVVGALAPAGPVPSISTGGVVPLYSTSTTIQPGEWVSIYGNNLAGATALWNGNFPISLGGTSVAINGKQAYLWLVSPGQINMQAPNDTATGTVPVAVTTATGTATSTVTLGPVGPSFSLLDSKHVAGIILRSGGAYDIIGPTGTSLGYQTVAAQAGDSIELFGVGFGPTSPPVLAGQPYSGAAATTDPVTLFINTVSVTPAFAGLSSAGLYQINLTLPAGLGTGDVPLMATVGGVETPSGVVISLQ